MKTCARPLALSCVLLYVLVGIAAGACPSSPEQTAQQHQHHHKPAAHTLACVWACHATANQGTVDVPAQLVPVWLVLISLPFAERTATLTQSVYISARPPPSSSV